MENKRNANAPHRGGPRRAPAGQVTFRSSSPDVVIIPRPGRSPSPINIPRAHTSLSTFQPIPGASVPPMKPSQSQASSSSLHTSSSKSMLPRKRRRAASPSSSFSTHVKIKPEPELGRSAEEYRPTRRLVQTGCKRIAPVPFECRLGEPHYKQARREWQQRECAKLLECGLKVTKTLIREDGMALDWESPHPVWSDTLLRPTEGESNSTPPDNPPTAVEDYDNEIEDMYMDIPRPVPQQQQINISATHPQTPKTTPRKPMPTIDFNKLQRSTAKKPLASRTQKQSAEARGIPVPSFQPKASGSSLANGHSSNRPEDDASRPEMISAPQLDLLQNEMQPTTDLAVPESISIPVDVNMIGPIEVTCPSSWEDPSACQNCCLNGERDQIEQEARDFMSKYYHTFDSSRNGLSGAYAENATFSIRLASNSDNIPNSPQRSTPTQLVCGRKDIMRRLRALSASTIEPRNDSLHAMSLAKDSQTHLHLVEDTGVIVDYAILSYHARLPDRPLEVIINTFGPLYEFAHVPSSNDRTSTFQAGSTNKTHQWNIAQTFVLRRPSVPGGDHWPLVAVVHQITIFRCNPS